MVATATDEKRRIRVEGAVGAVIVERLKKKKKEKKGVFKKVFLCLAGCGLLR